tara:strand:+ start:3268 stop:4041 length:774 start_codon:yes stop_codon:yes gene_type:complete
VITDDFKTEFFRFNECAKDYQEMGQNADYYVSRAEHYRLKYIGRTGKDPETGQKVTKREAKAARMKDRTCTYCQQKGHTRRTCSVLEHDMTVMGTATKFVRRDYTDRLRMHNINKGTLIMINVSTYIGDEWGRITVPYMISSFLWKNTSWTLNPERERIIELTALTARIPDNEKYRTLSLAQLESAIENGQVTLSNHAIEPPSAWLDGETTEPVKTYFPLKTHRNYDFTWRQYTESDHPLHRARVALGLPDRDHGTC